MGNDSGHWKETPVQEHVIDCCFSLFRVRLIYSTLFNTTHSGSVKAKVSACLVHWHTLRKLQSIDLFCSAWPFWNTPCSFQKGYNMLEYQRSPPEVIPCKTSHFLFGFPVWDMPTPWRVHPSAIQPTVAFMITWIAWDTWCNAHSWIDRYLYRCQKV